MSREDRASFGISDSNIRLSVGLEDANDLIEDLNQALAFCALANQASLCDILWHKKHQFRKIDGCILRCDSVN